MSVEIPGIEIGDVIGRGGNATVHAGVQLAVGRPVAVKVDDRVVTDERNQRRFVREATAAGRISAHPHVVSLIDAGTTADHHPYLVMELCEGGSLADVLTAGPLPLTDALDIGIAVTGALAAAHAAGILHRDVKPANILIDAFGTPRLSDFGLASRHLGGEEAFTATMEALTPAYAPPEAFARVTPDARSDVWSMGATIYALLAGGAPRRRPDGTSPSLAELVIALPEPLRPLPGAEVVMPVLWKATAYEPAERHGSAVELRDDLIRVRSRLGPPSGRVGGPEVTVVTTMLPDPVAPTRPPRRPRTAVAVGAAALVLGLLGGSAATWFALGRTTGGDATLAATTSGFPSGEQPSGSAPAVPTTPGSPAPATPESAVPATPGAVTPASAPPIGTPPETIETPPEIGGCWGGLVFIAGNVSASARECTEPHSWETYAHGLLDPATVAATSDVVAEDPVVLGTCTSAALTAYLGATADPAGFTVEVVPPSEAAFLAGRRGFACVVMPAEGGERTGSLAGGGGP